VVNKGFFHRVFFALIFGFGDSWDTNTGKPRLFIYRPKFGS